MKYIITEIENEQIHLFSDLSFFLSLDIFRNKWDEIINTIYPPIKFLNHYVCSSDILKKCLPVEYTKILDHIIKIMVRRIENELIDNISYTIFDDVKREYTIKKINE